MGDRDAAGHGRIREHAGAVAQRLRPAGRRRVLRADAAAGRQQAGPVAVRPVDHDADVAAARHAFGPHHGGGERLLGRHAERQRERPGSIVRSDGVPPAGQSLSQEDLGHVVAARAELVQDLAFRDQARFFQRIERARHEDRAQYGCPVLHDSRIPVPTGIFASLAPRHGWPALESKALRTRTARRCPRVTRNAGEIAAMTRLTLALIALAAAGAPRPPASIRARRTGCPTDRRPPSRKWRPRRKWSSSSTKTSTRTTPASTSRWSRSKRAASYDENRLTELRAMQAKKNNAAVDEVQSARRPLQRTAADLQGPRQAELTRAAAC